MFKSLRQHGSPGVQFMGPRLVSMCENAGRRLSCLWKEMGESAGTWSWTSCWENGMTSQVSADRGLERKTSDGQLRHSEECWGKDRGVPRCLQRVWPRLDDVCVCPRPPRKGSRLLYEFADFFIVQKCNTL